MFGLKLKTWMETHLGRPRHKSTSHQNQKRVPKDSISSCSSTTVAASTSHSASSVSATSGTSISTSSSSTNTSCSIGSTTTAIAGLTSTGSAGNNPTFSNNPTTTSDHLTHHQEKNSNFQAHRSPDFCSVTTTSSATGLSPSTVVGSESVTVFPGTVGEGSTLRGGGGCMNLSKQKGDASGTRGADIEGHALGESDPHDHDHGHQQQPSANCSSNNGNGCTRPSVTTSVSNSTSILSGGSFSNSLSSPDTGYSTDGYSPKSVYPALSFESSSSSSSSGNCKSTTSTSKSSYTISSLASNELLHPSKQTSSLLSSTGESCSVQNDFEEYGSAAPSPSSPAALTSSTPFSQSCSSGISTGTGTSDGSNNGFPKGQHQVQHHHHHHSQLETSSPRLLVQQKLQQQHSIGVEDGMIQKQQVIIGGDEEVGGGQKNKKPSIIETRSLQVAELPQQKLSPPSASSKEDITTTASRAADPLTKQFAQFSIDFKNQDIISAKHNGRTHRRAESMDARTPSHEDYKPLVQDEDETGCGGGGGGNSSLDMTGTQGKNIRTFINGSGHVVEFSSYKNAYSICSPRRERTRIKTNPWLILNSKSGNSGDKDPHANPPSNSSASEEESTERKQSGDKMKGSSFTCTDSPKPIIPLENPISMKLIERKKPIEVDREGGESGNIVKTDRTLGSIIPPPPPPRANLEINKRRVEVLENEQHETKVEEDEEHFTEDETGIIDHDGGSSSSLLFRISTSASASDSGKGTLEPTTNRNSTESSCLLSDSTTASTRNSIISHETEPSGSRSGRSSSGESIASSHHSHRQHNHHHHHHDRLVEDDTLGHASPKLPDTGSRLFTSEHQKEQHQHIHQRVTSSSSNTENGNSIIVAASGESGLEEPRTFRNAAVATDLCPEISSSVKFPKSASVSVGVGTTGSNKSGKFHPIMVDKETDILSDWGNTDEDGDEEIETDGDRNDNETVTPAPSSPGTDNDRGLFSQSTSSATDIDFGDSSAATQASSTAVFPPSSLIRQPHRFSSNSTSGNSNNINGKSGGGGTTGNRENGARFHYSNNEGNGFCNGNGGGSGETLIATSQMLPGSCSHYQHNINMNLATATAAGACYPSVVPIIRPVLVAAAQHQGPNGIPDAFTYDIAATNMGPGLLLNHGSELVNHHHAFHPHAGTDVAAMCFAGGVPNFNLDDEESDYPEIKGSSAPHHSKGIARGALGFLRKIFKKGACASQRHSPDSVKGKKGRGKSDNNLAGLGLGSPLLTISEPLSNPRYSAVLTTKKQMNPALNGYFLTPTPNSFRRRSGNGTDSSDSKSSKQHSSGKSVKTDIIRLPQGTLSPTQQQQSLIQRQTTSSSHSSGSSCSGLSTNGNGIPQQHACSTFFPPGTANFHHQLSAHNAHGGMSAVSSAGNNSNNLHPSQSNTNTNSTSASSSAHSLMSTSTASGGNNGNLNGRPPSQNQSRTPIPSRDPNYYANSSPTPRQSIFIPNNGNCNSNHIARGNGHHMSPPPLISENSPYLGEGKNLQHQNGIHTHGGNQGSQSCSRRDRDHHHSHSQSPGIKGMAPCESPRLPSSNASATMAANARMNSPSFNNYSPIHRIVVTGGTHLLNRGNPNCPNSNPPAVNPASSTGLMHYPQSGMTMSNGESPLPIPRYTNLHNSSCANGNNNGNGAGNNNNPAGFPMNSQIVNRPGSHHHHATSSPSPLINHRYPSNSSPHPYPPNMTPSQQQHHQQQQNGPGHFFASPSPILRNPRYQYITSSNQNSPVLNASKRMNMLPPSHSHVQIHPSSNNGLPSNPNGPPPLLTTFAPLPSSSSSLAPRDSLINNNSFNTNTITGSPNLNSSDPFNQRNRQAVSTSLSYNEFENLSRQQQTFLFHNNGNNSSHHQQLPPPPSLQPHHHPHNIMPPQPQQQLLHQSHKSKIHHQNHYYSSPIVKGVHPSPSLKQTFWNSPEEQGRILCGNNEGTRQNQQRMNQNLRFNSFLVGHRQLPRFYHTQWGLQERIYESLDSEETASDEMSGAGPDYDQDGNEIIDRSSELSLPVEVHPRIMQHGVGYNNRDGLSEHLRLREGKYLPGQRESTMHNLIEEEYPPDCNAPNLMMNSESHDQTSRSKSKRSKPKSLSASGKPFPRPVVALPMMPGTFLSETETRLLEQDKESDRKYKRLINEAEALLKEISVEKCKRSGTTHDNNPFRLENCPQSDPLRRKAYDCWALRRLQQELAGCCASPPVLHRSRLNLQSPLTPTVANNPFLSHFQQMAHPSLPQQVPYMNSSGIVDNNQNNFDF